MVKVLTTCRSKKVSLVSGNWPGKNVFIIYYITYQLHFITYSTVYQNIYLLFLKKDITNTQTQTKKQKKLTKKRDIQNKPKKKRRKKCCCGEQYL